MRRSSPAIIVGHRDQRVSHTDPLVTLDDLHGYARVAAEDVDYALRLAFFRDSVDVSIQAGLREALAGAATANPDIDQDAVLEIWRHANPRGDVANDFAESENLPIRGSPQIFVHGFVTALTARRLRAAS